MCQVPAWAAHSRGRISAGRTHHKVARQCPDQFLGEGGNAFSWLESDREYMGHTSDVFSCCRPACVGPIGQLRWGNSDTGVAQQQPGAKVHAGFLFPVLPTYTCETNKQEELGWVLTKSSFQPRPTYLAADSGTNMTNLLEI